MADFIHLRHKPPAPLATPRPLVIACPAFRSNVNFSRIVRAAGCCGVTKIVTDGNGKVDPVIARDGADQVDISVHRSLLPVLQKQKAKGIRLVGLEQTTDSQSLHEYRFHRESVVVIGHERNGIREDILKVLDDVVEIPVYGLPYSYNVATATAMTLYEYCRQFPNG